jgi:flagellar basal body-associated protein FliL
MEESENIVEDKKFNWKRLIWISAGIIVLATIGFAIYFFILTERDNSPENFPELEENITNSSEPELNPEIGENITSPQNFSSEAEEEIFSQFGEDYNPPAIN